MGKLKGCLIIDCVSFTIVILVNLINSMLAGFESWTNMNILQIFIVTTTIAVVMTLTEQVGKQQYHSLIRLIEVFVVVAVYECIWGMFQFDIMGMVKTGILLLFVYIVVSAVMTLESHKDAKDINSRIRIMREKIVTKDKTE